MSTHLVYGGTDIELASSSPVENWVRTIDGAAAPGGTGWLTVPDVDGVEHWIRLRDGVPVRLYETRESSEPPIW